MLELPAARGMNCRVLSAFTGNRKLTFQCPYLSRTKVHGQSLAKTEKRP